MEIERLIEREFSRYLTLTIAQKEEDILRYFSLPDPCLMNEICLK